MSPKNKGKFGKAKPAIEPTDEFVSGVERIGLWLRPHAKQIGFLVGAALVVFLAAQVWMWNGERKLGKANTLFQRALAILEQEVQPPPPEPAPGDKDADKDAAADKDDDKALDVEGAEGDKGDAKTFPSLKARAEAALVPLGLLQSEYGGTAIAKSARKLQAAVLLDAERWDDAVALYTSLASSSNPVDAAQAREGIGYALEGKAMAAADPKARDASLAAALDAFTKVQPNADGPLHDMALYHQARLMAKLGRKDEAVTTFKKVLDDSEANESLRRDVKNRLAALGSPPEE